MFGGCVHIVLTLIYFAENQILNVFCNQIIKVINIELFITDSKQNKLANSFTIGIVYFECFSWKDIDTFYVFNLKFSIS